MNWSKVVKSRLSYCPFTDIRVTEVLQAGEVPVNATEGLSALLLAFNLLHDFFSCLINFKVLFNWLKYHADE